ADERRVRHVTLPLRILCVTRLGPCGPCGAPRITYTKSVQAIACRDCLRFKRWQPWQLAGSEGPRCPERVVPSKLQKCHGRRQRTVKRRRLSARWVLERQERRQ